MKILVILTFFLSAFGLYSQNTETLINSGIPGATDSICFRYYFVPGDSLYYLVEGYDSVIVDYDSPILRRRFERWLITCDSINSSGRYIVSMSLITFFGKESQKEIENVERSESPWLNRKITLEIDSLGRRYSFFSNDSINPAVSPGGAYAPFLLINFGAYCKAVNESWDLETLEDVPENAFPVPLIRQASLFRAIGTIDTLGYKCNHLEFIKTGQGNFRLLTEDDQNLQVSSVLNGFGTLYLAKDILLPQYLFQTLEQKIRVKNNNDSETIVSQYSMSTHKLESHNRKITDINSIQKSISNPNKSNHKSGKKKK